MIAIVDNYDSFTYNLAQYLGELGAECRVFRNDAIGVEELGALGAKGIVLSPGPGIPERAGICIEAIRRLGGRIPILGVCLGHQAVAAAFGGRVVRAPVLMHGKTSAIHHGGRGIFAGLPNPLTATRYHSLIVERESLPRELEVSAWTAEGLVMGLRHRSLPIEGVQFHPESCLTPDGRALLGNFLRLAGEEVRSLAGVSR